MWSPGSNLFYGILFFVQNEPQHAVRCSNGPKTAFKRFLSNGTTPKCGRCILKCPNIINITLWIRLDLMLMRFRPKPFAIRLQCLQWRFQKVLLERRCNCWIAAYGVEESAGSRCLTSSGIVDIRIPVIILKHKLHAFSFFFKLFSWLK